MQLTARSEPGGFGLARRADDAYSLDTRRRRNAARGRQGYEMRHRNSGMEHLGAAPVGQDVSLLNAAVMTRISVIWIQGRPGTAAGTSSPSA